MAKKDDPLYQLTADLNAALDFVQELSKLRVVNFASENEKLAKVMQGLRITLAQIPGNPVFKNAALVDLHRAETLIIAYLRSKSSSASRAKASFCRAAQDGPQRASELLLTAAGLLSAAHGPLES